jgi:predicted RNA-binding protein with PIN domain
MHYYIDGYNLMFRVLKAGDNLQTQRELIISDLKNKIHFLNIDATLVFDSHSHLNEVMRAHYDRLEIIFTSPGETADEFILKELKENPLPAHHTVVTSDKNLAWLSRRRQAKTETVDEFLRWLNQRYNNKLRRMKAPQPTRREKEQAVVEKLRGKAQVKPKEKPIHTAAKTPDESFDYYLETFEKRLKEQQKEVQALKSKPVKLKKLKKIKPEQKDEVDESISDMARWLQIFENRLEDEPNS